MRKTLAAMAMVVAVFAGMAAPSGAASTGSLRLIINGRDDVQSVFAVGVVTGRPDVISVDEDTDVYVFPEGSFTVFHPETSDDGNFNDVACVGTATFAGTFTLKDGTGAYTGISGGGTYTGKAVFWTTRTANGCSENDADGSSVFFVTATGTATLP